MPFKKFLLFSIISSFLFLVSFSSKTFAVDSPVSNNLFLKTQTAAEPGQIGVERWTDVQIASSLMSVNRGVMGTVPPTFFDQLQKIVDNGGGKLPKLAVGGALNNGVQMVAAISTPPNASGIQYIASVFDNITGKPAYAQGFGFTGLQFLLPLWKAARNIVYVISSIIFVVIGLMIILRVKISPQAVVTIQSAVPQVITTLILVTFSYAIAGLMIDLANLIAGVVFALIYNSQGIGLSDNLLNQWHFSSGFPLLSDIGQGLQNLIDGAAKPFSFNHMVNPDINTLNLLAFRTSPNWISLTLLSGLIGSVITGIFLGSVGNIIFGGAGNGVGSAIGMFFGGAGGGLIGALIVPIIFCIMIGIWLIKLYFGLIKVYVTIIFKIISGPLEIAMGAFPNAKTGFNTWLLDLFANIMVFPIVTIFLVVLNLITDSLSNLTGTVWVPGLINLGGGLSSMILSAAVGMAGLALISKLPDLIPQYIFMIKPSPFGAAIGENLNSIGKSQAAQMAQEVGIRQGVKFGAEKSGIASATPTDPMWKQNLKTVFEWGSKSKGSSANQGKGLWD